MHLQKKKSRLKNFRTMRILELKDFTHLRSNSLNLRHIFFPMQTKSHKNYPATPLIPAPPLEPGAIIEPMPNDDAFHTSLWLPCQRDVNLKTSPCSLIAGSKGDFSTNSFHIRNYPTPPEGDGNKIAIIKKEQFSIPDPWNSKDPNYCVWNYTNCPSDGIKIILNQNKKICYQGPKRLVNAIVMQYYLGGMGFSNYGQCGIEKYYYAKDIDEPSITWGYVYYEYIPYDRFKYPPSSWPSQGLFYKNEVFSTPYPPDLRPYIPLSAEEKH